MTRLFAFGCSFTNYRWSTWADCLAPEFDSFENWGQAGGGNHYIFNSVMEADQRHHFGAGDTVIVCWTSFTRDDRYVNGRWHTLGNMFACPIYNTEYLKTHVGKGASIGANATIVCGHDIGEYAFIGAGAVVTKTIPAYALVVGNPAKVIKSVSDEMLSWKQEGTAWYQRIPAELHDTWKECEPLTEVPSDRQLQSGGYTTWQERKEE
jgi:hypothetical protein